MNKNTRHLIDAINQKLKNKPLIFFSREVERSIGLEAYLENYYIACIEDHYIIDQLIKNNPDQGFCLSRIKSTNIKSTQELINDTDTKQWVRKITKNKAYFAQLFQFNAPTYREIQKKGNDVVNNISQLNRRFEAKLSQYKILKDNNISIPNSFLIESNKITYNDIIKKIGNKFVVQLDRATTGNGTFFIENQEEWNFFLNLYSGNLIKVSELLEGETFTINGCITSKGIFISGLQYQITGFSELASSRASTVGNDWSYTINLSKSIKGKIFSEVKKIGEIMSKDKFKGMFGVDLIIKNEEIYIIEINARQTANIPMQTKLEIEADRTPLSLLHLAEFMNIEIKEEINNELFDLKGSQVFLRAKSNNTLISNTLKSGIYNINEKAEKLANLTWLKDGYSTSDLNKNEFIFLIQKKDIIKDKSEEIARMQFKNGIINNGKIQPWITRTMVNAEFFLINS